MYLVETSGTPEKASKSEPTHPFPSLPSLLSYVARIERIVHRTLFSIFGGICSGQRYDKQGRSSSPFRFE